MTELRVQAAGSADVATPGGRGSFGHLIPWPSSVTPGEGRFALSEETGIVLGIGAASTAANLLRSYLRPVSGLELPLLGTDPRERGGAIRFRRSQAQDLGSEGYELLIEPDQVEVVAQEAAGFGWAVQTIRQLLPAEVEGPEASSGTWVLPAGTIRDVPRFPWRGAMLDVARHFFAPADVRRVIDLLAAYKLNRLHLHLTDDQGWRIEIARYPELTEIGGRTAVGGGPGGYYTREDYRGLGEYAAERGIILVPEIDMPGHTHAALASVAGLNCDGVRPQTYTGTKVGFSSLCVDNELTYQFIDDVLSELSELTPGPYIHIGGDESNATEPDDYRKFVTRVLDMVRSHGKTPIGWEEVCSASLGDPCIVQHWFRWEHATLAAGKGARLILSPSTRAYLDMKYDDSTSLGLDWAGCIDTRRAHQWDPGSQVPELPASAVLGLEAPLWTETIGTLAEVETMMLPRLPGYAELGWSSPGRSWDEYRDRLAQHAHRWKAAGRAFTEDPSVPFESLGPR